MGRTAWHLRILRFVRLLFACMKGSPMADKVAVLIPCYNEAVTIGKVGDKEIDFVCEDQGQKLYIQVAYLLASEDTIEREFGVYDRVRDNYPKYVVTLDEYDMSRNGIKHRNIRDFLLQEEWN